MRMIIGGAYQGKLEYAMEKYGVKTSEIWDCTPDSEPEKTARCLNHYENYILYCLRNGSGEYLSAETDKILIFTDIFCGVVPMDTEQRLWRETCGRAMTRLAKQADSVERLFCGLALKLK